MTKKLIDATDIKTVGDLAQAIADGREMVGEKKLFDEGGDGETFTECPITAAHSIGVLPQVLAEYSMKEWVKLEWYDRLDETGPVWCQNLNVLREDEEVQLVRVAKAIGIAGLRPLTQEQLDAFGLKNGFDEGGE